MVTKRLLSILPLLMLAALVIFSSSARVRADNATPSPDSMDVTPEPTPQVIDIDGGYKLEPVKSSEEIKFPKLNVSFQKPVLSGPSGEAVDNFNKAIDNIIKNNIEGFKEETIKNETEVTLPPEIAELGSFIDLTYEVYSTENNIISVKFLVAWYNAGAAHPNSYSLTVNYDLSRAKTLQLADVFNKDAKFLDVLSAYSVKDLQAKDALTFPDGAAPTDVNYKSWNITPDGILITFDDYQVTPHALGPQEVLVPYSELKSIIRADGPLAAFVK
jgi:hypothetical protein